MLSLPGRFLLFWYGESVIILSRSARNLTLLLEEDLAVGLMLRLLFTPLFHDSTILGRVLSFFFRLSRILIGLFGFGLIILLAIVLVLAWFFTPVILLTSFWFWPFPQEMIYLFLTLEILGLALFLNSILHNAIYPVWKIKSAKQIWYATRLKPKDAVWDQLISTDEVQGLLTSLEIDNRHFGPENVLLTDELLNKVWQLARSNKARFVTPAYFWVAMVYELPAVQNQLLQFNLKLNDIVAALSFLELKRQTWRRIMIWEDDFAVHHLKGINRGWLGVPTPILDSVATDLTKQAAQTGFDQFVGRGGIVSDVVNILSASSDRNVLLVGPAGVGKSSLVRHLASRIVTGDAPDSLATKRLVALDIAKLLSGVNSEGDLAQKIKSVFDEVNYAQNIIIYVDDLENLGIGQVGESYNLYAFLTPYLESNQYQFIASTQLRNYTRTIEKNTSLARLFHKVELLPATPAETLQTVEVRAIHLARHQKVNVTFLALKQIVDLSARFIHDLVLPDSALSLLEEVESGTIDTMISSDIVKQTVEKRTKVPVVELNSENKDLLLHLEVVLHSQIIGQDEAIGVISNTLRRAATSLKDQSRPIGSFLFVGPTGVGKTHVAKVLARTYFKDKNVFMQFDMSEYQTAQAVDRLIGSSQNSGELTEAVKNRQYGLILLDEFEKANPQILTLFLQVLEEGHLTDFSGDRIDFTNTIIIATSNAASLLIANSLQAGSTHNQLIPQVRQELLKTFKPELVNRFDEIVIFKPLTPQELEGVVRLDLARVSQLLNDQGYRIDFSPDLVTTLARKGFDPILGARPLRRLIQDTIESKLSTMILEGKLQKGRSLTVNSQFLS